MRNKLDVGKIEIIFVQCFVGVDVGIKGKYETQNVDIWGWGELGK